MISNQFAGLYDCMPSSRLVSEQDIQAAEKLIGVLFGEQLRQYILTYGYLGYKSVQFYGMNSELALESNMIIQTQYLHQYFPKTSNNIVFESCGDGCYCIVDSNDNVLLYDTESDQITPFHEKIFDYINKRFREAI